MVTDPVSKEIKLISKSIWLKQIAIMHAKGEFSKIKKLYAATAIYIMLKQGQQMPLGIFGK